MIYFSNVRIHWISSETLDKESLTSQAVIILFPDARITDRVTRDITETFPDTLPGKFFSATQKILGRYKIHGYRIFGIVYADTTSDLESGLYDSQLFDSTVSKGINLAEWNRDNYQSALPHIIEELNLTSQSSVVVGGYHATDCVVEMASALRQQGHSGQIDLRLTNELPFLLASHKARKFSGTAAPLAYR